MRPSRAKTPAARAAVGLHPGRLLFVQSRIGINTIMMLWPRCWGTPWRPEHFNSSTRCWKNTCKDSCKAAANTKQESSGRGGERPSGSLLQSASWREWGAVRPSHRRQHPQAGSPRGLQELQQQGDAVLLQTCLRYNRGSGRRLWPRRHALGHRPAAREERTIVHLWSHWQRKDSHNAGKWPRWWDPASRHWRHLQLHRGAADEEVPAEAGQAQWLWDPERGWCRHGQVEIYHEIPIFPCYLWHWIGQATRIGGKH